MLGSSSTRRRARWLPLIAMLAVFATGCHNFFYETASQHQIDSPDTRPWWCHSADGLGGHHSIEPSDDAGPQPVTEPQALPVAPSDPEPVALETEGLDAPSVIATKGMLSWTDCLLLSQQLDEALHWAEQWPTRGEAEAAGFIRQVNYATGMGTHHQAPDVPLDSVFDPTRPEFLQYAGNTPDAPLVGMSWYVYRSDGTPPPGFPGDNDVWHVHEYLCFHPTYGVIGDGLTDEQCASLGGTNVYLGNYYMVHAWIVPGMQFYPDVFINHHPCLKSYGVAPLTDDCWSMATTHAADL